MARKGTRPRPRLPVRWAPPAGYAGFTAHDAVANRSPTFAAGQDRLISLGASPFTTAGGIVATGGRNLVVMGGVFDINRTPDNSLLGRTIYLKDQDAGAFLHIEGVRFRGAGLTDAFNIQQPNANVTLTIQNCIVEDLHASDEVSWNAEHPDFLQCWTGPTTVRIHNVTVITPYQCFMLQPLAQAATTVTYTPTGAYTLTVTPSGGSAATTASIAQTATAAALDTAITAVLPAVPAGALGVTVSGSAGGPYTVNLWPPYAPATVTGSAPAGTITTTATGWTRHMTDVQISNVDVVPSARMTAYGEAFYLAQPVLGSVDARNIIGMRGSKTKDEGRQGPPGDETGTATWPNLLNVEDIGTTRAAPVPLLGHFAWDPQIGIGYTHPGAWG